MADPVLDPAVDILARTLWGEARGEGPEGMAAVACVIINRLAIAGAAGGNYWWGNTVIQICQRPKQFSCWNADDPNRPKLLAVTDADPVFAQALQIAAQAVAGGIADITGGATHYVAVGVDPAWLHGAGTKTGPGEPPTRTARIGRHVFYKLV